MTNEELATRIQAGEDALTFQLWQQCYGFIHQQAMRWARAWESRPDFDADDLTQAGYIALCEAVRGYQKDRGSFLCFLSFYLKTEFSKVAGCRTEAQLKDPLNGAISLDAPAYNDQDNETTIGESIPVNDPGFEAVEDGVFNGQLAKLLDQAMEQLPENQRLTIELHYLKGLPYIEIAEILHCAVSFPGRLTRCAFRKIRHSKYAPALSEYLYGERNYYRHTGFSSWKYSGSSSPELELLHKEQTKRDFLISRCIKLGMTIEQAERLFPA